MHRKILPLAFAAGLIYALWPKARFLGDKARIGDTAVVPPSALMSQDQQWSQVYAQIVEWQPQVLILSRALATSTQPELLYGRLANLPVGFTIDPLVSFQRSAIRQLFRQGQEITL